MTTVVNFGEVRRAQLAKSTLLTSALVPLGSFKVCSDAGERERERERGAESNGKLPHLFNPDKTAELVPVFAMEDLPSSKLQPRFLRLQ